ncbi:MAG: hypothetical protein KA713_11825 [Chryseotalea sp. WA131a]|nr:MAG: hypothetical protein KA713_11825 [Chryseotalea sp. WA131a]
MNNKPITIALIGRSYSITDQQISDVDLTKLVDDTGSFTISRADLQRFPSDCSFDIILARGNQQVINNNTVVSLYNSDLVSSRMAIE